MLDNVFELFVQSNRTLDRAQGGLGVGLTLVRSLVAMHGGTVSAHGDGDGKGIEFVVRLPLERIVVIDEPANSQERVRVLGSRRPTGRRIAIVEDNADSREMLCEQLARARGSSASPQTEVTPASPALMRLHEPAEQHQPAASGT